MSPTLESYTASFKLYDIDTTYSLTYPVPYHHSHPTPSFLLISVNSFNTYFS